MLLSQTPQEAIIYPNSSVRAAGPDPAEAEHDLVGSEPQHRCWTGRLVLTWCFLPPPPPPCSRKRLPAELHAAATSLQLANQYLMCH